MRLVQFTTKEDERRVGAVSDEQKGAIHLLDGVRSTYELARRAIATETTIHELVEQHLSGNRVDYDTIATVGRLLPPFDHPTDPAHCLVTGSGMTHQGSADVRHPESEETSESSRKLTDLLRSMGRKVESAKTDDAGIGTQPGWFYKGDGSCAVPPGKPFKIENFSLDGSEEPEIVGLYLIGEDEQPYRIGFAIGNELSDHLMEQRNYLHLAHSKLRQCSFGPELLLGDLPQEVKGTSRVLRDGRILWEKPFLSGETHMTHSIANLEYHHFKYRAFRRPGDIHIHFLGTSIMSFADGIETRPGDVFEISAEGFGRPLRNELQRLDAETPVAVHAL